MTCVSKPMLPYPLFYRRTLILGAAAGLAAGRASAACPPPRVLFVCPAGSVKSAIAREALRQRAAAVGLAVSVASRGLRPEDHVSPALAANLQRDGLDPAAEPLRALAQSDIAQADLIVAFDEASEEPMLHAARAWKTPSWNSDYPAAKADLDQRLTGLLTDLRTRAATPCATP